MLTFLTWFFLKIDQVLALGPAPPHWWPELEFRDRFGADGVQLFWCTFSKKTKWQPKGTAHRTAVRNISGVAQRARCRHGVLRERIRQRRTASNIYARRPNRFSGLPNVCTSARPSRRARAIASRGCICIFMNLCAAPLVHHVAEGWRLKTTTFYDAVFDHAFLMIFSARSNEVKRYADAVVQKISPDLFIRWRTITKRRKHCGD